MKKESKQFNFTTIFKSFLTAFNVNHGLIPTLRDLLINPAIVIKYYIEGKIDKYGYNKYFSPGRFFVTVLAILSIFAFFAADISDSMYELFEKSFDVQKSSFEDMSKEKTIRIDSIYGIYSKIVMFFFNNPMFTFLLLIIPSTLSTRLVFKGENYNLAKHLVVNIYCFCFISLMLGIFSLFFNQEEYLIYYLQQLEDSKNNIITDTLWKFEFYNFMYFLIPILYYFYSFKKIFNLSWVSSIFKTLISFVLSSGIIFFTMLVVIITIILI